MRLAVAQEFAPEESEFPLAIRAAQTPGTFGYLFAVVGKAQVNAWRPLGHEAVLDDQPTLLLESRESVSHFLQLQVPYCGQEEDVELVQLASQHFLLRKQHSGPAHPCQIVEDNALLVGPGRGLGEVDGHVRQRLERTEIGAVLLEHSEQRFVVRIEQTIRADHGDPIEAAAGRAEAHNEAGVPAVAHEAYLCRLVLGVVHPQEGGSAEVTPRRTAIVRVIDRVAVRERRVGQRGVGPAPAKPEVRDAGMRRDFRPDGPRIRQVLLVSGRQDETSILVSDLLLDDLDTLGVRIPLLLRLDALRGHLADPLAGLRVAPSLVPVQAFGLFPVAAEGGVPVEPNPAEAGQVRIFLSEERVPAPEPAEFFRQRVLGIPVLVMEHCGHGGHRALAHPGERHQTHFVRSREHALFHDRACRARRIHGKGRIQVPVRLVGQWLEAGLLCTGPLGIPRSDRRSGKHRDFAEGCLRIDLIVRLRLALVDVEVRRIAGNRFGTHDDLVPPRSESRSIETEVLCADLRTHRMTGGDGLLQVWPPQYQLDSRRRLCAFHCPHGPVEIDGIAPAEAAAVAVGIDRNRRVGLLGTDSQQAESKAGKGAGALGRDDPVARCELSRKLPAEIARGPRLEGDVGRLTVVPKGLQRTGQRAATDQAVSSDRTEPAPDCFARCEFQLCRLEKAGRTP